MDLQFPAASWINLPGSRITGSSCWQPPAPFIQLDSFNNNTTTWLPYGLPSACIWTALPVVPRDSWFSYHYRCLWFRLSDFCTVGL